MKPAVRHIDPAGGADASALRLAIAVTWLAILAVNRESSPAAAVVEVVPSERRPGVPAAGLIGGGDGVGDGMLVLERLFRGPPPF